MFRSHKPRAPLWGDNSQTFVNFFIQYCLSHCFKSKKQMSRDLDIGYHTILRAANDFGQYKGASLVFQELVWYCVNNGISLDEVVRAFYAERAKQYPSDRRSAPNNACRFEEYLEQLRTQKEPSVCAERLAHFAELMNSALCAECQNREQESTSECFVRRTLGNLIDRLQNRITP